MRGVGGVAVGTIAAQAEDAVAIATRHVGLGNKGGRAVHIGNGHRAAGRQYRVGFGEVDQHRRDHRRIVGACNREC